MPSKYFNLLLEICNIQSYLYNEHYMFNFIISFIRKLNLKYSVDSYGNIYVTKGHSELYPTVICHMDTVHKIVDGYHLYTTEKDKLFAKNNSSPTGIGGDDKCGIFVCLYKLINVDNIKIVFFSQEENGQKGSRNCNKDFFNDSAYILQADRQSNIDLITEYWGESTISQSFSSAIEHLNKQFGFIPTHGSITDCMILWQAGIGVSCMNIGSGYFEPHTINEYIDINGLWNTTMYIDTIIKTLKLKKYKCKPESFIHTNNCEYSYKRRKCSLCQKWKWEEFDFPENSLVCYKCKNANKNTKDNSEDNNKSILNTNKYCTDCHTLLSSDLTHIYYLKEQPYCIDCFPNHKDSIIVKKTDSCWSCHNIIDTSKAIYVNNKFLCQTCFDKFSKEIGVCDICNFQFTSYNLQLLAINKDESYVVCEDCYKTWKSV